MARRKNSRNAAQPPTSLSAPGVHPAAPFFVHRFCAPAGAKRRARRGALFLKGRHKFALWNDTIALRLKNRVAPLFPQAVRQKQRTPGSALARRQKPRAAPRFCGRLLEKNKRGKTPRPNSWTEASAPAANRAEREHRRKGAQSAAAPPTAAALSPRAAEIVRKANMCA